MGAHDMNDVNRAITEKKRSDKIREATKIIIDELNIMGADDAVQKAMLTEIISSHRTLQQSTINTLIKVLTLYSKLEYYDGRNEASVQACREIGHF